MDLKHPTHNSRNKSSNKNIYELPSTRRRKAARRRQTVILFLLMFGIGAILYVVTGDRDIFEATKPITKPEYSLAPATFDDPQPDVIISSKRETISCAIESGATITSLLGNYFSPAEIHIIATKAKPVFPLHKLCAGHQYSIELENEQFISFRYDIDAEEQLIIEKKGTDFSIERKPIPYTVELESIGTAIESSLFSSVAAIGESSELAMKIMDIFAWDIDFIRDIRSGDYFCAIVEKRYRDGKLEGYGRLLGAYFNNNGEDFYAFYFADGNNNGYYDEQGKSLRKAFLKAPLSYTRISSGYTKRRFHPVLNKWKPHLAIDYAAPTGTPVKAIADGTVIRKSYDRNNGNMIRLRHPNSYESTYIHLSKFRRGIKKGKRVKQGDVIGYVGSTGLATGPHLDFRIFKNGTPINPLKLKSTPAQPIPEQRRDEFNSMVANMRQRLQQISEKTQQENLSRTATTKEGANAANAL